MSYFTFEELIRSEVATKNNISNEPCHWRENDVYERLWNLVINLLDPIRERFGVPMIITSGYRCEKLNKLVGGVSDSQHRKGEAVDFYFSGFTGKEMREAFFEILRNFEFDQMIYYKKQRFIHISWKREGNRYDAIVK